MYNKAVDFHMITLKFVPDRFLTNRVLEKLNNLYFLRVIYIYIHVVDSDIIKFLGSNMGFNNTNFITLTLVMIILMKVIQKLLIMLDL